MKLKGERIINGMKENRKGTKTFLGDFEYCPQCKDIQWWDKDSQYCSQCDQQFYTDLVNLTPHDINYFQEDGSIITIKPTGKLPRLDKDIIDTQNINGVKISYARFDGSISLPAQFPNRFYIVSLVVALSALRSDLIVPDTVRDESGKVIGCDGFTRLVDY